MTENSVPVPCCESGFGKNFTAAGISLPDTDQPFSSSGTVLVQDLDPRLRIVFPYPESHQHYANPQNSFFVRVITVGICPEPKKQISHARQLLTFIRGNNNRALIMTILGHYIDSFPSSLLVILSRTMVFDVYIQSWFKNDKNWLFLLCICSLANYRAHTNIFLTDFIPRFFFLLGGLMTSDRHSPERGKTNFLLTN